LQFLVCVAKSFSISPCSLRGDLNLTLLPASGLRLSFIGDDGSTERLFTLSSKTHCPAVEVHEIPADSSGRSFNLKISDGRVFYFWCSEKSKLLGIELLAKVCTTGMIMRAHTCALFGQN
jgi:hypothetical protein